MPLETLATRKSDLLWFLRQLPMGIRERIPDLRYG